MTRRSVLVVTLDTLGDAMAGPAIRVWEMAHALAPEHDVRLLTFGRCDRPSEVVDVRTVTVEGFRAEVDASDVVVIQGFVALTFPWLQSCPQVLVVDLYDPFQLETLEVERYRPIETRYRSLSTALAELGAQVRRGDLFLCASPRQRDLWIGHLAAAGRVNPDTYDDDPDLSSLLAIAPFGMSATAPVQREPAIKGVVPGIGVDDIVLMWGGGVYNWFDPITLIRAVDRLREEIPNLRLYFLGMKHPNPDVPEMAVATRSRELADERGLTGVHVFFNESWVPYARRADYLLDADIGVSTHFRHVETEFSFRTRILDYLWAGLPILTTQGDSFAALVAEHDLGRAVPANDVDALADALREMVLTDGSLARYRENVTRIAPQFHWERALAPLLEFCRAPRRAADAHRLDEHPLLTGGARPRLRDDLRAAVRHLRAGGLKQVVAKIRWRLARRGTSVGS